MTTDYEWWRDCYRWDRDTDRVYPCFSEAEAIAASRGDRVVARTKLTVDGVEYLVSTVFLGRSYDFYWNDYFETMAFRLHGDGKLSDDLYQRRAPSAEYARDWHKRAIEWVERKGWEVNDE